MRDKAAHASERGRANVLLTLAHSGLSQRGVARALGHAPSYVNKTVRRFREGGLSDLAERRGGHNRLPQRSEIIAFLPKLVAESPSDFGWNRSTWSVELVMLQIERALDVRISRPHVGRMLREANCRRVRPRPLIALTPPDHAEQVAAMRAEIADAVQDNDVVLYSDEVDIHLNPKVGPDWTPPGVRKTIMTPGRNSKEYIAGAYHPATDTLLTVDGQRKDSLLFIALLELLASRFAGTVHLVVDNYIIHKSRRTQAALARLGGKIRLYFLPPYCPVYNPIERVWWDLHEHVTRNHKHPNMGALMNHVRGYVRDYDGFGACVAARARAA